MDAITYIQHHGIGLYAVDGQLKAYPRQRLTVDLRSFIRDHRDTIIEGLKTPDLQVTARNILALTRQEMNALRVELADADEADPWREFDREAFRIAEEKLSKRTRHVDASSERSVAA